MNKRTVLLSGSSGLIGSALIQRLKGAGWTVIRLMRANHYRAGCADWLWDYEKKIFRPTAKTLDAVIHLAGENIAGRWTDSKKCKIYESRVAGTQFLVEEVCKLPSPPQMFISASAVGYYGDRGDEKLFESSPPGAGFLARLCVDWERACAAASPGMRTVQARFGIILSAQGGALAQMLTPFRMGLGGSIGSARQYVSWISLFDAVEAIVHILECKRLSGPVNVVSPNPCENAELVGALANLLHRPAFMRIPTFMVERVGGEFARETLLASARALPGKLAETNFHFRFPELKSGLAEALK